MRPTKRHMKVERYVEPAEFDRWKRIAEDMGFLYVASGPLVRSSYKVSASMTTVFAMVAYILPCRRENFTSRTFFEEKARKTGSSPCLRKTMFWSSRRSLSLNFRRVHSRTTFVLAIGMHCCRFLRITKIGLLYIRGKNLNLCLPSTNSNFPALSTSTTVSKNPP